MKLRYITCSDPRSDIPLESLLNFAEKYPMTEFGVQAHMGAMSENMDRFKWFDKLVQISRNMPKAPNLALHVNYEWCDYMNIGAIPYELADWILTHNAHTGKPTVQRIQLNIGDHTFSFNSKKLANLIKKFSDQEFILPWNHHVADKIQQLKETGAKFSLLYDNSYGAGIEPKKWYPPVYDDVPNGYAGGLGPDNVEKHLDKINAVLPHDYTTWIDAEGKLRDPKTTCSFTLESAEKYVQNVIKWQKQHTK